MCQGGVGLADAFSHPDVPKIPIEAPTLGTFVTTPTRFLPTLVPGG